MTVAELRKALEDVPDDLEVLRAEEGGLVTVDEACVALVCDNGFVLGDRAVVPKGNPVPEDAVSYFIIDPPDHGFAFG